MIRIVTKLYYFTPRISILFLLFFLGACNSRETVFQGYVEGDYVYIASSVSGNLTQRLVNRGDQVLSNQPLFVLDPQPETAQLDQAKSQLEQADQKLLDLQKGGRTTVIENIEAQLKQAQASLNFSQKTFERYRNLYRAKAIGKANFDEVKSQYEQSLQTVQAIKAQLDEAKLGARENLIAAQKAAVASATASVKQAQWTLLQKSVRSPVNAQVFDTIYELGEFVRAGQPVIVLLPPQNIKLIFFVPEKIVGNIKIGDEIIVDCDSCKDSYRARVNFIAPNAEFTPPVIFSQASRDKLVYRIEAKPSLNIAKKFHPGQPIDVMIARSIKTEA